MTALEKIREIKLRIYGVKCPKCLVEYDIEADFLLEAFKVMREVAIKNNESMRVFRNPLGGYFPNWTQEDLEKQIDEEFEERMKGERHE